MEDLENAGGIPAVLSAVKQKLVSNLTVSGKNIMRSQKISEYLIKTLLRAHKPYHKEEVSPFLRAILLRMAAW